MQNLGQTRVFYKPGQTRLTHDLVGLVDLDDPIRFQPDIHPIKLSVNFRVKSYSDWHNGVLYITYVISDLLISGVWC